MAELTLPATRDFTVDEEFSRLLPVQSDEEKALLDASIAAHGVRDPGVVWKEEKILLDGHRRLAVCDARGIAFPVVLYSFADRAAATDWIIDNALARRNLTEEQRGYLRGKRLLAEKKDKNENLRRGRAAPIPHREGSGETAERLAKREGVSRATIERDAKFAANVDALEASAGPETKRAILDGSAKATRRAVSKAAAAKPTSLAQFKKMVGEFPARRSSRADRDHVAEINALAVRLCAALRSYAKSGARKKDRARLTELWELRTAIGRLHAYLEGDE